MAAVDILIADDHETFRRSLRSLLESRSDWRVCAEAADGEEAVVKAVQLRPDIVLMDLSMPRMDGAQATRIIRQQLPESEVVIVSQNDSSLICRQAAELGASGYIAKNNITRDLLPTIEKVIKNNGHHKRIESARSAALPLIHHSLDCLTGAEEMAERIRSFHWSQTPLGPIEQWPQSLKTSVSICLASRFPIVMYWGQEYVVLYNDAYSTILGGKHPWALGRPCRECWAEIWDTIGPMLHGVIKSGQATWSDDLLLPIQRRGYPEECYFSFSFSPIRVETGVVGGIFTAVLKTTEKVIGERRLKTLRDLAARAVESTSEADAWRIAAETLGENVNDIPFSILCEVSGTERRVRILGTAGVDNQHPLCGALTRCDSPLYQHVIRVAGSRESVEGNNIQDWADTIPCGAWKIPPETMIILPLGEPRPERPSSVLLLAVNPHKKLDDSYRTFLQLVANQVASSVADARSDDDERKRTQALAELDRAKTRFFSNVSHEFRTPLTLMLGPLEDTLAARDGLGSEHREHLELAHRNSLRLLKLVNTLLDFSRIEAGRIEACYEPIDVCQLTSELASVFRSASDRAGLRLVINCEEIGEQVYVDREMWEKIVFNLLSNALKFTFAGEIEVSVKKVNNTVELAVRDTGTGIPSRDLPHLFERFYRVKEAHGRTLEGSGIGLALVQELAKLHGGTVRVESKENSGSAFFVNIPVGKDHLQADRIGAVRTLVSTGTRGEAYVQEALRWLSGAQGTSDELSLLFPSPAAVVPDGAEVARGSRILLADDNADMREYVQRLLRQQYDVVAVADGQAALESARQRPPDLILTDLMMPRLDGFGLLRELRAEENLKNTPVILLSARAGEESRIEGLESGADDYLIKPFSARELLARVGSHLAMAKLRREAAEMERKLRAAAESERTRLHELLMQAPAAIGFLSGLEHRFTFVNLDYLKLTGRQRAEDIVGKTVREAFPELEGQGIFELLDGVYQTGIPYIGTARKVILNRGAGGHPEDTYFDFIYQPMRDAAGRVDGVLIHGNDVTQQVLSRQEIEKRERQFRTLAESIPQLVWMAESDGYIFWYNQRWYEYTGTTPEQMEGWGWQTVHDPDVLPMVLERWKHSIAKGEPFEMVFPLRGVEGVFRDFLTRVHPVKDENGAVTRWFGTNTDVTAQRKAELAVRESERRFREMIDALPAAIYTTDAEGRLTHFNPAAVEFSGRTPELGTDQWCVSWKLYYPDGRLMPHDECPMAIALKEGRIIKGAEAIAERPDGTRRWFIPYPTPIRDSQGKIIGGLNMLLDIAARKQAEEVTAHLAAIVASSDDAIISKNLDGIIQSWNQGAEHMFGYTAEEAVGKHITLIVPKDRWGEERDILARLRRGERVDHFQTVRRRKDGSTLHLSLTISPVKDSAGRVIGASKVARDITHLKQIERALRDSEERFRSMVETTPECVKVVAPDGTLQHMNSSGLAMVGAKDAKTVVGKSVYDLIAPEDREKCRAFNERICRGDKGSLEFDMIGLNGTRHHMETHAAPMHNPDGRTVQLAITHDVTERKRAELALRESEQRYRAVTDASPIMVWMSGTDKLCYYFNKGWLDFVGRTLEQESGNGWAENVHSEDFDRCLQIYVNSFDARRSFEMEYRLRHHTGQYRWIVDHGTPRYAPDGTFEGYVGGCLDIHDQKEAAENARRADASLQLMKLQDEERRHIARELHDSAGQTLTVLGISLAQLAQKTGRRSPEIATDIETIQETVQQLHREIRTTSYLLHPPLLDENGLAFAINWYVDGIRERSDLDIRLEIPGDFGRLPGDMELVIFRLVQECLTNIHRHSASKNASIRMARESGQITLDVRDEGNGMTRERLAEIRSGRSGVGIRGMQERLRQFEGKMNIESGSRGTRIFVTIPIPQTALSEEQSKIEPLQAAV